MSRDAVISLTGIEKQSWREGWDETLDAPPTKPMFQRVACPPRLSLNGILISLLSTLLLVMMGFVIVSLPSPLSLAAQSAPVAFIQYTFQLPLALMIGAFLGPFMGTAAILAFLGIGLFAYPVFANGGGPAYVVQPGFGYLLGVLLVGHLVGKSFHKVFLRQDKASRSIKIVLMSLVAVLLVHTIGVVYLSALSLLGLVPFAELPGWTLRLSVETLPYDLLATTVFLCMVRQIRLGLWLVLY